MDDLHDETSDLHDEAAHVADELASADGGMLTPLSDARLAANILRRWFLSDDPVDTGQLQRAIKVAINALAERERWHEREAALLAERKRLLAIARAVDLLGSPCTCPDDDSSWQHDCVVLADVA